MHEKLEFDITPVEILLLGRIFVGSLSSILGGPSNFDLSSNSCFDLSSTWKITIGNMGSFVVLF